MLWINFRVLVDIKVKKKITSWNLVIHFKINWWKFPEMLFFKLFLIVLFSGELMSPLVLGIPSFFNNISDNKLLSQSHARMILNNILFYAQFCHNAHVPGLDKIKRRAFFNYESNTLVYNQFINLKWNELQFYKYFLSS